MIGLVKNFNKPVAPAETISWQRVFSQNPKLVLRFAAMPPGYIEAVLKSRLSIRDKFYFIFGMYPNNTGLLGNIFEEIGGWFSNAFSQQNLSNVENWIRQGSVTAQNIANALNFYSNAPTANQIAENQQNFQNLQSQIVGQGSGIWQSYGPALTIGAIMLAGILLIKK